MEGRSGCRLPSGASLFLVILCAAELILLQVRMRYLLSRRRRRKALLIGINYGNTEEQLSFPQRDTKEMRRLLKGGVLASGFGRLRC